MRESANGLTPPVVRLYIGWQELFSVMAPVPSRSRRKESSAAADVYESQNTGCWRFWLADLMRLHWTPGLKIYRNYSKWSY
ncbi:hypothetical protein BUE65_21690 [Klebsiella variicola]|nr:hypothetical protein BUE65_21690 [Klebsiella variicola]